MSGVMSVDLMMEEFYSLHIAAPREGGFASARVELPIALVERYLAAEQDLQDIRRAIVANIGRDRLDQLLGEET